RLGVGNRPEKVAAYYHQMEQGLLPASGVADRVLEALGQLVGESAEALRDAGKALQPPGDAATPPAAAFARHAYSDAGMESPGTTAEPAQPAEWDEVDELFRGG